ncbi:MAG TPA: B-box zinc finger protein [Actinomycetota bacterium]|nr:B-box zinc finger protein [Actinomycetota bacterium]
MPVEERSTRSLERCDQHPTRSAVARCEGCGRPLCLSCAVPVRGEVLGAECLPEPFGSDLPRIVRPPVTVLQLIAGAGLALALLGTVLPWSRFGVGSGAFGAWGEPIRWATLTVVAVVLALLAWGARRALLRPPSFLDTAIAVLAGVACVAALLSVWHPPAFARTWIGPWVAFAGGAIACTSTLVEIRARRAASVPT